jgi:3-hydroxyisobutyrate dehydrogenase-like beta-hydroxyacid dehydrogenase
MACLSGPHPEDNWREAVAVESIGLVHPGEMGAGIGAVLVRSGYRVYWASTGRRQQSVERARVAGLVDVESLEAICERSDLVLSVCPPHAALDVAKQISGFKGIYLDANAIAPATAGDVADLIEARGGSYVDGAIIGSPPASGHGPRLYLSGPRATEVREVFSGTPVEAIVIPVGRTSASALKMSYAAWSKGSAALLLSARALAVAEEVDGFLLAEWQRSQPDLEARSVRAGQQSSTKGWRWVGEMEEIAKTYRSAGLPEGFHRAAADMFARSPRDEEAIADEAALTRVLEAVLRQ